jgi:pimeloyl-ACP methyl ester carboxylesterase
VDAAADGRLRTYAAGLAVRATGWPGSGASLLVLHGAGSAGELELTQVPDGTGRACIAFDLPGHGDSQGPVAPPADAANAVLQALRELGVHRFAVRGRGLGAAVAVELALALQARAASPPESLDLHELRLWQGDELQAWSAAYAPPIVPQWDGAHLLRLWHELRDRQFFLPWFARTRDAARRVEPELDAEGLTAQVFAALRCTDWVQAHRLWFEWPAQRLALLRCPTRLHAEAGDGWARDLAALGALLAQPGSA